MYINQPLEIDALTGAKAKLLEAILKNARCAIGTEASGRDLQILNILNSCETCIGAYPPLKQMCGNVIKTPETIEQCKRLYKLTFMTQDELQDIIKKIPNAEWAILGILQIASGILKALIDALELSSIEKSDALNTNYSTPTEKETTHG